MLAVSSLALYAQSASSVRNAEKIARALYLIETCYLDTVDVDKAIDRMLDRLMQDLDPHSTYMPKESVEALNEPLDGTFEGVGIEYAIISDTLTVQAVVAGGPAEAVGLRAGDKIVAVGGETIAGIGLTNDGVRSLLRGPKGSKVVVSVLRRDGTQNFTIRRDRIPIESVEAVYEPEPGIVYMKITRFARETVDEVIEALRKQVKHRPHGMILDLRGNGGGFMHVALALADLFLEKDQLIVRTEGRDFEREERATGLGVFRSGPVVVLVDESSASASEILAGALQDWDRAVIVGRRTFGKGLVQQQYMLPDGSGIRLTVARYHTPSGRVVQSPYEPGHRTDYYRALQERYGHGESFSRDSISLPDSLAYKTLRLGRTVYGGGGILPDVFVPYDTTGVNRFAVQVIGQGLLTEYVNDYIDRNRERLAVHDLDAFDAVYAEMEESAYAGLLAYCAENDVAPQDGQEAADCEFLLKTRLKALVSRSALGTTGYWRVINRAADPEFRRALEVVRNWDKAFVTEP